MSHVVRGPSTHAQLLLFSQRQIAHSMLADPFVFDACGVLFVSLRVGKTVLHGGCGWSVRWGRLSRSPMSIESQRCSWDVFFVSFAYGIASVADWFEDTLVEKQFFFFFGSSDVVIFQRSAC